MRVTTRSSGELLEAVAARPPVWKSKFYGAFVLNRRVVLHATRYLLDGAAMPVPQHSTEPARPRHRREMTS